MKNITVIGFGGWGIVLACLLAKNGHNVVLWRDNPALAEMLITYRENKDFLPGVIIPDDVKITTSVEEASKNVEIFVFAVTSRAIAEAARVLAPFYREGQILVNTSKGLIEDGRRICEFLEEIAPQCKVACLSGPSHAEEVSRGMPTTVVAASRCNAAAETVQDIFSCDSFRVYTTNDVVGCELGGVVKNVIALAAGIVDGLGFGDNTKAALMTRGSAEITRLGVAMGADERTFAGLSGIGDLIVTCTSRHSRNWRAGNMLAQGRPVDEVLKEVGMVVEGVNTARAARKLAAKYGVDMPIVEEINKFLFEGKKPADVVIDLMMRDKKDEN